MTINNPKLDDRRFQDFVDEARRAIPAHCPEWTDHNLSDPGITLIELFAWMIESLTYRLNRIPELVHLELLKLLGITLQPPEPARAEVTFRLTRSQSTEKPLDPIRAGTQVATVRTDTLEAITFTTLEDLNVKVPTIESLFHGGDNAEKNHWGDLTKRKTVQVFRDKPEVGDYFDLGFGQDVAGHTIALRFDCSFAGGFGFDPTRPPWLWQYWAKDDTPAGGIYKTCLVHDDSTAGLNRSGIVVLDIPLDAAVVNDSTFLRCSVVERTDSGEYQASPVIVSIHPEAIGGTVLAEHSEPISNESLGRSDGSRGQSFFLARSPVLTRTSEESVLEVVISGADLQEWTEVQHFAASSPDSRHFTLQSDTGEIRFGPIIRSPNGEEVAYGAVPEKASRLRYRRYRHGGGTVGRVGSGTLTVLKSAIPYVDWVTNYTPAEGGLDAETLDHAKLRAVTAVRRLETAVVTSDYELLAREASTRAARVRCVNGLHADGADAGNSLIRLMIVPNVGASADEGHDPAAFVVDQELRAAIEAYLEGRRPIGTILEIAAPDYTQIRAEVRFAVDANEIAGSVSSSIRSELLRFLHPVAGGTEGKGWPFGGTLTAAAISARIGVLPGVAFVDDVRIYKANAAGAFGESPVTRSTPSSNGLFLLTDIEIQVVDSD